MQIDTTSSSFPNNPSSTCTSEFKFPIHKEQLLDEPADPTRFWVQARRNLSSWQEDAIFQQIDQVSENLQGTSKCVMIMDNDNFDTMFSIIYYLEEMSAYVRKEVLQTLNKGLKNLIRVMEKSGCLNIDGAYEHRKSLSSGVSSSVNGGRAAVDMNAFRNALKAYVYLITWFLSDNNRLKETKDNTSKNRKKPLAANPNAKKSNANGGQDRTVQYLNEIIIETKQSLQLFIDLIEMDIQFLWLEQRVEEDLVKLFIKTGFSMLENQNNCKIPEIKDKLFEMMQKTMERFGGEIKYMQSQNSTKIIDLLYTQDNLAQPMAEFVSLVAEKQGPQMPNEIIRELTKQIFHNDSSHETVGIKNVGIFLRKLSKLCPRVIYQNISSLLGFFDCESYLLRQAIIKILANIINLVLSQEVDDPHTQGVYNATKEKFFELLIKRFLDKSSYCRVKVIKVFVKLSEANVIPRYRYFELLRAVIGRLRDQTTMVRKNALKLFAQLLCIYSMIFNVDMKAGQQFMQIENIINEKNSAIQDTQEIEQQLQQMQVTEAEMRAQIMQQRGIRGNEDQAYMIQALNEDQNYQQLVKEFQKLNELKENNRYIISTLMEYEEFMKIMDDAVQFLKLLLSSKTMQDTIETIKVFKLLYQLGIQSSLDGIKRMLTLLYSKEQNVQEAVYECYCSIYFDQKFSIQKKTNNLLNLLKGASLTDITCIEELMKKCVSNNKFEKEVYNTLWKTYTNPFKLPEVMSQQKKSKDQKQTEREHDKEEQRAAIQLLRMMGSTNIEILLAQKKNLYDYSQRYAKFEKPDFILIKEAVLAYEKMFIHQIQEQLKSKNDQRKEIIASDEDKQYIFCLSHVIIQTFGTDDLEWFCATETILNTLFNIKTRNSPEYARYIIQQLTKKLYSTEKNLNLSQNLSQQNFDEENKAIENEEFLPGTPLRNDITDMHYSQLFFVAGHISIKMLTYIEQIDNELKKSGSETFQQKDKNKNQSRENRDSENNKGEDELDQIGGGKEAEIEQYSQMLYKITEESLIQGGMLNIFLGPIQGIAELALQKYSDEKYKENEKPQISIIERSAILSLCKYMCVSSKICQANIDTLFKLLQSNIEFGVKANIIISIGDLFNRFPNILNEKTRDIFMLLHDKQNHVRRQALMVITHLILNDMLKLKGEIVDICMLLEDPDDRIKDQVKLFLHELHTKAQHIIYNLFPKAISRLSKEFGDLKKEEFENIAKNLLSHIDKDRQTEQLVDKLCHKLKASSNPVEWRNTAYCLSQMKYNEKIFVKLLEQYDNYKDRLIQCPEVRDYFLIIVQQAKKFTKPEMKKYVDEFEIKINADEVQQVEIRNQQLAGQQNISKSGRQSRSKPANVGSQQSIHDEDVAMGEGEEVKQTNNQPNSNASSRKRQRQEISDKTNEDQLSQRSDIDGQPRQIVRAKRSITSTNQQQQQQQSRPKTRANNKGRKQQDSDNEADEEMQLEDNDSDDY